MEALFNNALEWIALHPHLTGLTIFVIALLESFIVIGLLIPGAFILFGIGAIIATTGTNLSLTCFLVNMPKENSPNNGP